jgi:hypothetical protein
MNSSKNTINPSIFERNAIPLSHSLLKGGKKNSPLWKRGERGDLKETKSSMVSFLPG